MKYIITAFLFFSFSLSNAQKTIQQTAPQILGGYHYLIESSIDSAGKYDSLRICAYYCHKYDSIQYYRGMTYFYDNEIEYYWCLEYGADDVRRVLNEAKNQPANVAHCKCSVR